MGSAILDLNISKSDALQDLYEHSIVHAVCSQNSKQMDSALTSCFSHLKNNPNAAPRLIKASLQHIFKEITCPVIDKQLESALNLESLYQSADTITNLQEKVSALLIQLYFGKRQAAQVSANQIVQLALQYIQNNYRSDISLATTSNRLAVNYNYLSTLFKQETGTTFSKYLNMLRIEKAKELLLDPLRRINEVADLVGFNDEKYFCRVFKEFCGINTLHF